MELTTEQKAKIFALYLNVKCFDEYDNDYRYLFSVSLQGCIVSSRANHSRKFEEVKLILRTIEQLTDEEQAVIAAMYGGVRIKIDDDGFLQIIDKEGMVPKWFILSQDLPSMLSQYLISIGVCVPLFIAPNHPLNGQDAISLGLAIQQS